ncbi:MAG: BamA/TamA family outer membrane protein [Gemmatimonadetes bacterium]|nr:BamA/TamA family outer membrane protein [Gemmatimonadota bacterium]
MPPVPAPPAYVESDAPTGYEVSLHGVQGFDIGHLNRVDGWRPSFGLALASVRPNALPTVDLTLGFRSNRPRRPWFRAGATQILASLDRIALTAEVYQDTHTPDGWKIGDRENDAWLFLTRTDLRNYYGAEGARFSASTSDLRTLGFSLALLTEKNRSRQQDGFVTLTTLFGDDEDFRPNPPVDEGRLTSATIAARVLTASTQSPSLRVPGWNLAAELERGGEALGGDLSFWRGMLHLRRYNRLSERHWLNARVYLSGPVAGTASLPRQRFTYLGGPGSLPGFDTLVLEGDRAVLGTAEYTYQLPTTSWSAPVFLLWQLEIFSDVGNAVDASDRVQLYSKLHWDAGIGVSGVTVLGYLGVFVSQRLSHFDERSDGPRALFRLGRSF